MTKLIPAKCPSCAANLEFPEGMEMGHCMHCGAKVIVSGPDVVHYHYNESDFAKLMYNKEKLEQEIENLRDIIVSINYDMSLLKIKRDAKKASKSEVIELEQMISERNKLQKDMTIKEMKLKDIEKKMTDV